MKIAAVILINIGFFVCYAWGFYRANKVNMGKAPSFLDKILMRLK